MKRAFIWLTVIVVLVLSVVVASLFETSKAPSRSDGEYVIVMAALKPLLKDLETGPPSKPGDSVQALGELRKREIIKASSGLLRDVQVSEQGTVLLDIQSTTQQGNVKLRLVPDSRSATGWTCEALSEGEVPSPCRRVVAR